MNIQQFTLPAHWAVALINADTTGMEDDEETAMNAWFDATFPYGAHCVDCSSEDDDDAPGFMRWHDASQYVLACDCLIYSFDVLSAPLAALRHHVTGAIERGEKTAIAELSAITTDKT